MQIVQFVNRSDCVFVASNDSDWLTHLKHKRSDFQWAQSSKEWKRTVEKEIPNITGMTTVWIILVNSSRFSCDGFSHFVWIDSTIFTTTRTYNNNVVVKQCSIEVTTLWFNLHSFRRNAIKDKLTVKMPHKTDMKITHHAKAGKNCEITFSSKRTEYTDDMFRTCILFQFKLNSVNVLCVREKVWHTNNNIYIRCLLVGKFVAGKLLTRIKGIKWNVSFRFSKNSYGNVVSLLVVIHCYSHEFSNTENNALLSLFTSFMPLKPNHIPILRNEKKERRELNWSNLNKIV